MNKDIREKRETMETRGVAAMPNEKAASLHRSIVGIISVAVGLILVIAAAMKATDMELFARQIMAYGLVTHPLVVTIGAWAMIAFQVTLDAGAWRAAWKLRKRKSKPAWFCGETTAAQVLTET